MLWKVNTREALRSLYSSKQRTILALLGVIIGIGSVMAMLSVGETVKTQSLKQFQAMGTDILTISPGWGGGSGPNQSETKLTPAQFDLMRRYSHTVLRLSPIMSHWSKVSSGRAEVDSSLKGVRPDFLGINRLRMARGRFFSFLDKGQSFAVLGHTVQEKLAKKGARLPLEQINVGARPFTVIGVLAPADLGFRSNEVDEVVFVPLSLAERAFGSGEGVNQVLVQLKPHVDPDAGIAEIRGIMNKQAGHPVNLEIQSPKQLLKQMAQQMGLFTLLLAAVGSISLIVGGVGIMNMMLVSVTERRREIGIRRALGAKQGDIVSQFLVESIILSLAGGIIGIALGIVAAWGFAQFKGWPLEVPLYALLLCLTVALSVGLFFGYYPARKASRLEIIEALRSE